MYTKLKDYISGLTMDFDSIPEERKHSLQDIANFITKDLNEKGVVKLKFISTNNSQMSHLYLIWAQTAVYQSEIDGKETYSVGTETTAFNPRAVPSIERPGFEIKNTGGDNPRTGVRFNAEAAAMICFSRT